MTGTDEVTAEQDTKPCSVDGCRRDAVAKGMCKMHRHRQRLHGHPGPPNPTRHGDAMYLVGVRLPKDLVGRIDAVAHRDGILNANGNPNRSELIRKYIEQGLHTPFTQVREVPSE